MNTYPTDKCTPRLGLGKIKLMEVENVTQIHTVLYLLLLSLSCKEENYFTRRILYTTTIIGYTATGFQVYTWCSK